MRKNSILKLSAFIVLVFILFLCSHGTKDNENIINLSQVNPARLPYGFTKELFSEGESNFNFIDINGDGIDEVLWVAISNDTFNLTMNQAILYNSEKQTIDVKSFTGIIYISDKQYDIDNDGYKEIFISEQLGDTLFLHIWSPAEKKMVSNVLACNTHQSDRKWQCEDKLLGAKDINGDGFAELFIAVVTDFAYQPRYICAYDAVHKNKVWQYDMGGAVANAVIYDYDHDGEDEIICGTSSPDNGKDAVGKNYIVNGTSDEYTYFIILNLLDGNSEKVVPVGGAYEHLNVGIYDWKGDGTSDALVLNTGQGRTLCFIAPFDVERDSLYPQITFAGDIPELFINFDAGSRDGIDELLTV